VKKFVIEREIPKIGSLKPEQFRAAAAKSNEALRQLGPDVQWLETFVTADKTFCIYLAKDEAIIRRHAELIRPRERSRKTGLSEGRVRTNQSDANLVVPPRLCPSQVLSCHKQAG
jgi:hypothetical protein